MGKDRNNSLSENSDEETRTQSKPKSKHKPDSESEDTNPKSHSSKRDKGKRRTKSRKGQHNSSSSSEEDSYSESESEYSDSEEERRRKKRKRREREERERKKRKKDKEKKRRKENDREEERKRKKRREKEKKAKKKDKLEKGKKGAVTNSWGKYGVIRETDMWNKRPEFTAWLAEVKKMNLESLPNWEEKQLFKDFMEDHNTATFPSKKYYDLDAYYKHKMEKECKKGVKKGLQAERTVFNDEEQRRQELLIAREKQKEEEVENLKRAMQSGMAQAMKEQAQLREEMAYNYKIGNFEAAAAIQKRLDPDVAM